MLIGRTREIEAFERLLDGAVAGSGGIAIVCGEAGIGKTRVADEVVARAAVRAFTIAWGRAWETGGAPAYWPWIEVLRPLADGAAEVPPLVAALLDRATPIAAADGARADAARERFELFEAVAAFLRGCARGAPLLLAFDDLHAADVPSLELLAFVARGLRASRVAVLATYRDAESRLDPVAAVLRRIAREGVVLALRPLGREEVAEIVRQELGRFDGAFAGALYDLTEGNPLFVRETIDAVVGGAGGARGAPLEALRQVPLGGGVQALVRDRLARAAPETRALLDIGAVLGREVVPDLLADVARLPEPEARRHLDDAVVRGILIDRGGDRWAFSHVLVREALYRALSRDRRATLHAAIAAALRVRVERGDQQALATLAHHALAALPAGDPLDAIRTARLASGLARARLAYEEAIALLERALAAAAPAGVDEHEIAEIELALGWALTEAGALGRGRDVFRHAGDRARALGDPRLLARAALGQGGEYVMAEIRGELVDALREALAALGSGPADEDRRLRARLLARLAAALTPSPTPEEPLGLAREALAMTAGETDARTRIDVGVGVGAALADFAPPGDRIPVNDRLLADARAVNDRVLGLRALTRLACDHLERGDVAAADATIAARGALAEAIGHPRYLWQTPLLRSMRAMPEGRFADCEAEIAEARALAAEVADPNAARCLEIHRLSMLLVAGRPDDLRAQEPAALRVLDSLPHAATLRAWTMAVVGSRLGACEPAAHALRSLKPPHLMTARMARASLAEAAVLCGLPEVYRPLYATFAPDDDANVGWGPFAFSCGPPIARVLGLVAFALGRRDEGAAHCRRALALADGMEASALRAWSLLALGEGLADAAEARRSLEAARDLGAKMGMPEVVTRAERALGGAAEASAAPATPDFSLVRTGAEWTVNHAGRSFRLKDLRGFAMLASLLEAPGRELHVLDLIGGGAVGEGAVDLGDAGEQIDIRARDAYRRRIADLRGELDEAERDADIGRAARLRDELDALTDQVATSVGLGGRPRRVGSAAERARITVQRRIREAIARIAGLDAELGRHLDWTVRTGTFCAYEPRGRMPDRLPDHEPSHKPVR
jgi:hypothetical protein